MNEQQYTFARFWKCALQVNPHLYNENYRGQEHGMDAQAYQASLRSRERFWDIRVPKIDSIFDNSLVPRSSWSPGVPPQHRKLVAATHRSPI